MRVSTILTILTVSFFFFALPQIGVAQENAQSAKSLYAKATDKQLKEAKDYYRVCSTTTSMSAIKDCKCAATKYLETRLELGDSASTNDIIKKNLNSCLKNEEQLTLPEGSFDYSKVPKKYIDEALYIYSYCNEVPGLNVKYDCQCYAAEFLSKRIDVGKKMSQKNILYSIRGECKNVVGTTGAQYQSCMSTTFDAEEHIAETVTQKDYCECVAKQWAESYRNLKTNIVSSMVRQELIFQANMKCRSPNMYPDLIP